MSGERKRREFVGTGQCCSHRGHHLVSNFSDFSVGDGKREKAGCLPGGLPCVLPWASRETRAGASRLFNMLLAARSQSKIKPNTKLGLINVSMADF